MRTILLAGMLATSCLWAKEVPKVERHAMIFMDVADGFDVYLTAAIQSQHVPVIVTTDRGQADYEAGATHDGNEAGVKLVDLRNQQVVFACSAARKSTALAEQAAAVKFARGLATAVNSRGRGKSRFSRLSAAMADDPAFKF
jgi:hypothetical protein